MKTLLLSLTISGLLIGCSHDGVQNQDTNPAPQALTKSIPQAPHPSDPNCYLFDGNLCLAPKISKSPDTTCLLYDGDHCIAPKISRPADTNCEMYEGDICVAPTVR